MFLDYSAGFVRYSSTFYNAPKYFTIVLHVFCAKGTEAAKKSPKSGRFATNVNAIDWHLVSPGGVHYYFRSLNNWLCENGRELFGVEPDSREFYNVSSGLTGAKRAMVGKNYGCYTYKGWSVIPMQDEKARKSND